LHFWTTKMSDSRPMLPRESRGDPEVNEGDHDIEEELVLVKTIGVVGKWQLEKALLLASLRFFRFSPVKISFKFANWIFLGAFANSNGLALPCLPIDEPGQAFSMCDASQCSSNNRNNLLQYRLRRCWCVINTFISVQLLKKSLVPADYYYPDWGCLVDCLCISGLKNCMLGGQGLNPQP